MIAKEIYWCLFFLSYRNELKQSIFVRSIIIYLSMNISFFLSFKSSYTKEMIFFHRLNLSFRLILNISRIKCHILQKIKEDLITTANKSMLFIIQYSIFEQCNKWKMLFNLYERLIYQKFSKAICINRMKTLNDIIMGNSFLWNHQRHSIKSKSMDKKTLTVSCDSSLKDQ